MLHFMVPSSKFKDPARGERGGAGLTSVVISSSHCHTSVLGVYTIMSLIIRTKHTYSDKHALCFFFSVVCHRQTDTAGHSDIDGNEDYPASS